MVRIHLQFYKNITDSNEQASMLEEGNECVSPLKQHRLLIFKLLHCFWVNF